MKNIQHWADANNQLGTHTIQVVAGDVGTTRSRLVWFTHKLHHPAVVRFETTYMRTDFTSVSDLVYQFIADAGHSVRVPDRVVLALPTVVDVVALKRDLAIADVRIVSACEAAAMGVATLAKADYRVLNHGLVRLGGVRVVMGLGLAWMQVDADGVYRIHPTEAGHIDFAPADELQMQLLVWLRARYAHVAWARILSGAGLSAVHEFLTLRLYKQGATVLDAAQIHSLALAGNALARQAVQLLVDIYAAWVGNVAMLYQPQGGLYIAGGMAIHLQAWMADRRFMQICTAKGRMADLVQKTPIYLVTNPRLGLQGVMQMAMGS
ncbi:MAG: glucokinase [Sulfuriferula sp.]|nr:glucokinase [Sulfuriferula sp.]